MRFLIIILTLLSLNAGAQIGAGITETMQDHAPKYGVLTQTNLSTTADMAITKDSLGCNYVRLTINLSAWDGDLPIGIYQALAKGLKVIPVLRYGGPSPQPFVTSAQLAGYLDTVALVVDAKLAIDGSNFEVIIVENEEINDNYHSSTLADYGAMLQGVYNICHPRGIKVTNGGVYGSGLDIVTYRKLKATYGQPVADAYGALCMTTGQINAAETPGSNPSLETQVHKVDTVTSFHAYFDYINNHPYEVFSRTNTQPDTVTLAAHQVLQWQQMYLEFVTGKPCITNEIGQRDSEHPELTTAFMNEVYRLGFEYCFWYNSTGPGGAFPLSDLDDGHTLPMGTAYKNFVTTHQ